MKYSKLLENDYIKAVGIGLIGTEITETEYTEILFAIRNKPTVTATTDYRLREDLTWEEYETDPPDPDPEVDDSELIEILLGGDSE